MYSLNDLFPATFRGIPFLASDTSTTAGAKTVTHEYPNDSRRYVEDLGPLKKTFSLTGHVTGDAYLANRFALQAALEDGSIGILTHPHYGVVFVVPKPYTVRETTRALGEAVFEMTFETADPAINPTNAGSLISDIIGTVNTIDNDIQSAFADVFKISSFFPDNYSFARAQVSNVSGQFNSFKTLFANSGNTTDLATQQKTFSSTLTQNITRPAALISGVSDLFAFANNVSDDAKATGQGMQSLFGFGSNDASIQLVTKDPLHTPGIPTPQGVERLNNSAAVNYAFNCYALIYAYLNYAQADFANETELQTVAAQLEQQYLAIINGSITAAQPINAIDILGSDVFDDLETVRNLVRRQFDQDDSNIAKIIPINTKTTSVSLLSYRYYGTTAQDTNIISLNNVLNISFLSGNVNIVTDPNLQQAA